MKITKVEIKTILEIKEKNDLRKILRNIIKTQDPEEIKNFKDLYDYSNITDMSNLWRGIIEKVGKEKIEWKNIKFPIIDMINVEKRENIFKECLLYKINLINTHNVKDFYGGFFYTKNLEQISLDLKECENREHIFQNSGVREVELLNTQNIKSLNYGFEGCENLEKLNTLYLDNCRSLEFSFETTKIKEINLYNTGKIKKWTCCFLKSNIEEISLDMSFSEICGYMFFENKNLKKINLKNCKNIKSIEGFIQGCENLETLELNLTNVENMSDFINEKNNIKYLKLIGLEEYVKKQKIKEGKKNINKRIDINKDFCDIFFKDKNTKKEIIEYYKINPIPYIELESDNTTFNIISDNNSSMRIEKIKEKEKKCEIKKEKMKEKEDKIKSQKEKICEINL